MCLVFKETVALFLFGAVCERIEGSTDVFFFVYLICPSSVVKQCLCCFVCIIIRKYKKDIDIKVLVEWFLKAFLGSENKEY